MILEGFMAAIMKSTLFWDVSMCSLVEAYGRFGSATANPVVDRLIVRSRRYRQYSSPKRQ
jgi:hypothetical protein